MKKILCIFCIWLVFLQPLYAERVTKDSVRELMQLSLEDLMNIQVVSGSRTLEKLSETTATMHIITSESIEASGFSSLKDILRLIPGIQASLSTFGENRITFRGISSTYSEQVIIMLDSHILNDVRSGSATYQFLDSIPLDAVERIEIMKGPGSSMYGANAFLGLINIITKNTQNPLAYFTLSSSFNNDKSVSLIASMTLNTELKNDWKCFTSIYIENNTGYNPVIEQNAIGLQDTANMDFTLSHLYVKMEKEDLKFKLRLGKRHSGDAFGIINLPNDRSQQKVQFGFAELKHTFYIASGLQVDVKGYTDFQSSDNLYVVLDTGQIPEWHPLFPWNDTGYIGNTLAEEQIYGAEVKVSGLHAYHRWTAAVSYRFEQLAHPELYANFDPYPLDTIQDVSDYWNWIDPADRHISSVYLQDIWDITEALSLTLDCRLDRFSDFGTDFNPRIGLKYNFSENHKFTAIAGTSFRAPDILSMYTKNNIVALGNPDLEPENIQSIEAGISGTLRNNRFYYRINSYYNSLDNLIGINQDHIYMNLNTVVSKGLECSLMFDVPGKGSVKAAVSKTDANYKEGMPFPDYPEYSGSLIGELYPGKNTRLYFSFYWQSSTSRHIGDYRDAIRGYSLISSSLTHNFNSRFSVTVSLHNALNTSFYYPAPINSIPGDYPGEGRQLNIKFKFAF